MGKAKKGQNIWFSRELIESKAYAAIKTAAAHRILALFFTRRQFESVGRKGREQWNIKNNGKIEFTYTDAKNKFGISESSFGTAIDELLKRGFIDITASGQGVHKVKNLYAISDRWKLYGTPEYKEPLPRPKKPINRGFQKDNQYGRNCRQKKKSTVAEQHSSTVVEQHSDNLGKQDYVEETT